MARRQFRLLDKGSFLIIYKGFIRPHLEYAIQAWSPYLRRDIDCLEKVQRRATRWWTDFATYHMNWDYSRRLKLTTLEKRRLRGDLIKMYKMLMGKESVELHCFFTLDKWAYNRMWHELKPYVNKSRLDLIKNFFSQRVVSHWNNLPGTVDVKSGAFRTKASLARHLLVTSNKLRATKLIISLKHPLSSSINAFKNGLNKIRRTMMGYLMD